MPTTTSALASLLPLVGAVALTVQGIRRMRAGRGTTRTTTAPPPRPIEIPDPDRRPQSRPPLPDAACAECGTSVPARETRCTACARRIEGASSTGGSTALHWLVFLAVMTAIIGGGWLLGP